MSFTTFQHGWKRPVHVPTMSLPMHAESRLWILGQVGRERDQDHQNDEGLQRRLDQMGEGGIARRLHQMDIYMLYVQSPTLVLIIWVYRYIV